MSSLSVRWGEIAMTLATVAAALLVGCGGGEGPTTASSASSGGASSSRGAGGSGGAGAAGGSGAAGGAPRCARHRVTPSEDDATPSFVAAMNDAATDPDKDVDGQVRVYVPAGVYRVRETEVASNVRFEIEPGAVFRALGAGQSAGDWGMFTLGSLEHGPARNVTFTAGDGCGGPGTPVAPGATKYKPARTDFRGNDPTMTTMGTRGMANDAVPSSAYWPIETMWVVDIDPRATGAEQEVAAFYVRWAYDVRIERLFTIQNAEQHPNDIGEIAGVTSKCTAIMIKSPNLAQKASDPEDDPLPHRLHVDWHYDILAPSGQGANQIRSCVDCTFEHVYSHGGNALRVETDGIRTTCDGAPCDCTDAGAVFAAYSTVDGLYADRIEGAFGNVVTTATPHCQKNGTIEVHHVRGRSMAGLVAFAAGETATGGFSHAEVDDAEGCGGAELAQMAMPQTNTYTLGPPGPAIQAAAAEGYGELGGKWQWPDASHPDGLADFKGKHPAGSFTIVHPATCPGPWTN